jgi:dienelactone hydrolase
MVSGLRRGRSRSDFAPRAGRPLAAVASLTTLVAIAVIPLALPEATASQAATPAPSHHVGHASARPASVPTAPPAVPPGLGPPFTVVPETLRLFDPSRTTPARGDVPASSGRALVTDLLVPDGAEGPRPLVVFAHGWNSDPGVYQTLLTQWAQAGFVVAAPVFPDSTDVAPGSPVSDYSQQALDISFVITSLLASDAVHVDPTRIAVAGHSDGGTDVALLALDPAYADSRVRAYLSLSSEMPSGIEPYTVSPSRAALLVAVGSDDEYGLLPKATEVFDDAQTSSKALVVEQGGDHLGSFVGSSDAAAAMREDTTRFLELVLEPRSAQPSSAQVVAALTNPPSPLLSVSGP